MMKTTPPLTLLLCLLPLMGVALAPPPPGELKKSILRRVQAARAVDTLESRRAILAEIRLLEAQNPTPNPVDEGRDLLDGAWNLVGTYSDSGGSSSSSSMAVELGREEASGAISPQALLDLTYETLYKSGRWNWLAGGVANRKEQRSSGARSFQNLDLANNAIYNVVEFNAPFGARGCISVRGEVNREDGSTLGVCFIESSVTLKGAPKVLGQEPPTITVPLPRPRGFVTTTYLDGDWRISRGSRSNVFVTVRTPRESRREGGEGGGEDEGPYT